MGSEQKREQGLASDAELRRRLPAGRVRPIHPSWFEMRRTGAGKVLDPVD